MTKKYKALNGEVFTLAGSDTVSLQIRDDQLYQRPVILNTTEVSHWEHIGQITTNGDSCHITRYAGAIILRGSFKWQSVRVEEPLTVRAWFKGLPNPYRSAAIKNATDYSFREDTATLSQHAPDILTALQIGFDWNKTPEGVKFWTNYFIQLKSNL